MLLLFAPSINILLERLDTSEQDRWISLNALIPILMLVFGWGFLRTVPYVRVYVPRSSGIEDYSGITLLGIYISAQLIRRLSIREKIDRRGVVILLGVSVLGVCCHLSAYTSPFAFVVAMFSFSLFERFVVPKWLAKLVFFIAPSMFSVFMFHTNEVGYCVMGRIQSHLMNFGVGEFVYYPVAAIVVFFCGLLLDMPRRLMVAFFVRRPYE